MLAINKLIQLIENADEKDLNPVLREELLKKAKEAKGWQKALIELTALGVKIKTLLENERETVKKEGKKKKR